MKLLTRADFRNKVFERDNYTCVVPGCKHKAVDAHHLIERRLWNDLGYYLENGASLCERHHKMAERNQILPMQFREWIGIKEIMLPKSLDVNKDYNKWGVAMLRPNRKRPKYPSTHYLPNSFIPLEHTKDLAEPKHLVGASIIVTIKMDGSNLKFNHKLIAARNSLDAPHISFDMAKSIISKIQYLLPTHLDFFAEWLYAKHSIHYTNAKNLGLNHYLQLFAIYDINTGMWLAWEDVIKWAKKLSCKTVPIYYINDNEMSEWEMIRMTTKLSNEVISLGHEGIVIRNAYAFHHACFQENIMKLVRLNHVQTNKHWNDEEIIKNELDNRERGIN